MKFASGDPIVKKSVLANSGNGLVPNRLHVIT